MTVCSKADPSQLLDIDVVRVRIAGTCIRALQQSEHIAIVRVCCVHRSGGTPRNQKTLQRHGDNYYQYGITAVASAPLAARTCSHSP